ncbi:MAG: SPOR domain-containing protein [Desulfobacteraceae bacterium]|nr:SPOR domain-containing protein [Desulfobacteraceae bacterium]
MIRFMGNLSLRLWILALVAGPVCFYFMPLILWAFPEVNPVVPGGILFVVLGAVIGASFDFIGRKRIERIVKEGEIWERAGIFSKARKTYIKAVRIYDTFLLSPLFSKKIGNRLTGTLARFSLTADIKSSYLQLASAVYLKSSPGDETLATLWLTQLKKDGLAGPVEQEVLTALADIHYTHKRLMILLADVLLDLGRMDYSAKRVYKTLLDDPELSPVIKTVFQEKIHGLLGEPGESLGLGGLGGLSESGAPREPGESLGLGGVGGLREPGELRDPEELREPVEPGETLERYAGGRIISLTPDSIGFKKGFLNLVSAFFSLIFGFIKSVVGGVGSFLSFGVNFFGRVIALVRESEQVGFYLKTGAMGLLSVGLLFFMGSTISHMLNSRAVKKESKMIESHIPQPFTIQVAAYLKQSYANKYAAVLNKKGLATSIVKVAGGGKTWYVVRISEFPDKVAAAAFGKKLKDKKIINDFFVSNK